MGSSSVSSPSGTLSASGLTAGEHKFYFTVTDASNTTHTYSRNFLAYILELTATATPAIAMATSSGSSGTDITPNVTVSNLTPGDLVRVYSDSTCNTEAATAVRVEGTSATITVAEISGTGEHLFYARAVDLAGNASVCSGTPASYDLQSSAQHLWAPTDFAEEP